ncbi:hypothetical protein [Streptomyces sp. DH37]|uniref:hypothetical protein n=1 Tax=Streptomyces sp. DH37 TaxID=3040122 RepID=UPI002441C8BB|nr:hypothetical protein [Streptomyces sp. DH37]MDG9703831.1 hypothetical protein [Streptomyces sp. DH37]
MPQRLRAEHGEAAPPDADLETLIQVGHAKRPEEPASREPARPPRGAAQRGTHEKMLLDALAEAEVPVAAREEAAVAALAELDTATVGAVVQWIRRGKPAPGGSESGPKK